MKKYLPHLLDACPNFNGGETVSLLTVIALSFRLSCNAIIAPGRRVDGLTWYCSSSVPAVQQV